MNTYQVIDAFKAAMRDAGIEPPDNILADAILHRFHIAGHTQGSRNGAYKLHLDGIKPAGYFEDFKAGIKSNWKSDAPAKQYSQEDRQQAEATKKAREQKQIQGQQQVAALAQRILNTATLLTGNNHPYLQAKRIHAYGIYRVKCWTKRHKTDDDKWLPINIHDVLVVPLVNINGKLWNLQAIFTETDPVLGRNKDFLGGGLTKGCFHTIGKPTDDIIICEGYATGASLHAATGSQVLCALSANNLLVVAQAVRSMDPRKKIIIAADNDTKTPGNPGVTAAKMAAVAVGGFLAVPPVPGDFNDYENMGMNP